jgi:hypothetical protein
LQPHVSASSRRGRAQTTARARVSGAALLGLMVLAWWLLRAAGVV